MEVVLSPQPMSLDDTGEAFQVSMHSLINKYADYFGKPGNLILLRITHCIELLDFSQ